MTEAKIGLGRSNIVVTFAILVFLGLLVGTAVYGGATADETSARVLALAIGAGFAIPLVMMIRALPRFLSPRFVIVDPAGLHLVHGKERIDLPWPELRGISIGHATAAPEKAKIPTSVEGAVTDFLSDKASEALHVSGKRRIALEIYPVRRDAAQRYPRLKPYWKDQMWRFPLPPVVSIAQEIGQGARAFQPDRWLGWVDRPWS